LIEGVSLDLIKIHILPPACGAKETARLVIASPATRIVRSHTASPWEVFLRPEQAARLAVHYIHRPRNKKGRQ
jgi:hypothetical protein